MSFRIVKLASATVLVVCVLFHSKLAAGMTPLTHDIYGVPPYTADGEAAANDPAFAAECEAESRAIAGKAGLELQKPLLTYNADFGLVWRVDFSVRGGVEGYTDRIMFWRLPDGKLAKFIGSNLGVPPLYKNVK